MLGAVKLERDGLINGHSHGFRRGVAVVSDMNRNGFSLQASTSFSITNMPRYSFPQLWPHSLLPSAIAKQNHRDRGNEGIKSRSREASEFQHEVSAVPGVVLHEPAGRLYTAQVSSFPTVTTEDAG